MSREGRVPTVEKYISELKDGKWDDVSFEDSRESLVTLSNLARELIAIIASFRKSNGGRVKGEHEEPDGMDRALGDYHQSYDDVNRLEIQPVGKQVFVKTVPPSTRRVDLEEVSTEWYQVKARLINSDVCPSGRLPASSHHRAIHEEAVSSSRVGPVFR